MNPLLSMFRMRFSPMTARPTTPMSAVSLLGDVFFLVAMVGFSLSDFVWIACIYSP